METEFLEIDKRNAWGRIFQEIKNESNNYSHIIKDAKNPENKNLNRYRDVNPFDHSRVRLLRGDKDYINASLVQVPAARRSYILTQGPLPTTTGHFWLMVWEQESRAILMLNRVIEKNAVKCHQYWPIGRKYGGNDELILPEVNLEVTFISQKEETHYILREFQILDCESLSRRNVLQFHYTTWPDFGVPESPSAFLHFLFTVRRAGALDSDVGPPVVHCSAGIGRSGTFCLVDSCLLLIEKNQDPNCIDVRQCLLEMRHYRMGLIQTPDQLRFSYLAIIEGAKIILPRRDSLLVPLNNEKNLQEPGVSGDIQASSSFSAEEISDNKPSEEVSSVENDAEDVSSNQQLLPNPTSESLSEIRKRSRKEREEKTASIVQNIKKKQKETELWEKRRSFIKLSLGLVLIIGFGYFVYKNYSKGQNENEENNPEEYIFPPQTDNKSNDFFVNDFMYLSFQISPEVKFCFSSKNASFKSFCYFQNILTRSIISITVKRKKGVFNLYLKHEVVQMYLINVI